LARNPGLDISIERFDDVAFEHDGEATKLIQTKHHISKTGNLTDASPDLWKTLRVWAERVGQDLQTSFTTKFVLITTGHGPAGSAASLLRVTERNEAKAHELLVKVASTSKNDVNQAGYIAFLGLAQEVRVRLLKAVTILDGSPNIADVREESKPELKPGIFRRNGLKLFANFMQRLRNLIDSR